MQQADQHNSAGSQNFPVNNIIMFSDFEFFQVQFRFIYFIQNGIHCNDTIVIKTETMIEKVLKILKCIKVHTQDSVALF